MSDIARTIDIAKLVLATAEGMAGAIEKAKKALDDSTAQLREAIATAEQQLDEKLAADRADADAALDRKFDKSEG